MLGMIHRAGFKAAPSPSTSQNRKKLLQKMLFALQT